MLIAPTFLVLSLDYLPALGSHSLLRIGRDDGGNVITTYILIYTDITIKTFNSTLKIQT